MSSEKTVVVGKEYDQRVHTVLGNVLRELGAVLDDKSWGVGGSQELSTWKVRIGEVPLLVEAETYIGLSVSGPEVLVDQIASEVKLRMR